MTDRNDSRQHDDCISSKVERRSFLKRAVAGSAALGATALSRGSAAMEPIAKPTAARLSAAKVRYCLNTSTIRGQKLGIVEEIELAAKAGYDGIEPWINELTTYQDEGGDLKDLAKRLSDHGMRVESAIGFPQWIVDDEAKRSQALDQAKREMEMVRQIGGTHIAAPPSGATNEAMQDLGTIATRYHALLEVGASVGVIPQLELWGFSKTLSRLGELVYVASEAAHKDACVLPDVYHIYKGGSGFEGLKLLSAKAIHAFHMNDYPQKDRTQINDSDRVYPGDGVAPLDEILGTLFGNGFNGALSLELFNRDYWSRPAEEVVQTGLDKMKASVARVMG